MFQRARQQRVFIASTGPCRTKDMKFNFSTRSKTKQYVNGQAASILQAEPAAGQWSG